jgi:hypothetical protein
VTDRPHPPALLTWLEASVEPLPLRPIRDAADRARRRAALPRALAALAREAGRLALEVAALAERPPRAELRHEPGVPCATCGYAPRVQRRQPLARKCAHCGEAFVPLRSSAKYCKPKHRTAAAGRRARARARDAAAGADARDSSVDTPHPIE